MLQIANENRISKIKCSLMDVCHSSGIFHSDNIEAVYHENLIESGIIDSLGVVCLQDQIETHYNVAIHVDQFIAELHTLENVVHFLAADPTVQVSV